MKTIEILPAVEADTGFLLTRDRHIAPRELSRKIASGEVALIRAGKVPAGFLRWNLFWDNTPFLNLIWLDEAFRRRGIGSCAMEDWERRMAHSGYRRCLVSTQADEAAQHFYRARGYVDSGVLLLPGEPAELLMRKEL